MLTIYSGLSLSLSRYDVQNSCTETLDTGSNLARARSPFCVAYAALPEHTPARLLHWASFLAQRYANSDKHAAHLTVVTLSQQALIHQPGDKSFSLLLQQIKKPSTEITLWHTQTHGEGTRLWGLASGPRGWRLVWTTQKIQMFHYQGNKTQNGNLTHAHTNCRPRCQHVRLGALKTPQLNVRPILETFQSLAPCFRNEEQRASLFPVLSGVSIFSPTVYRRNRP